MPNMMRYICSDAWLGLRRNKGATVATTLFLALSISFIGIFMLVRVFVSDVTDYLHTQLSMKVYVSQQVDTEQVEAVLAKQSYIKETEIERGEDILQQLSFFFSKRDYLLEAFKDGKVNDAIHLTLTNSDNIDAVADALSEVEGIEKVVYPQKLAHTLNDGMQKMTLYGGIITVVLLLITLLMVYMTFHLALHRRARELKVKLLVGMNPQHLRTQFMIEGAMMALGGAVVASFVIWFAYHMLCTTLQQYVSFLTPLSLTAYWQCTIVAVVIGLVMSLLATVWATRKWLRHA